MRYSLLAVLFGSLTAVAAADDWPQFRGPDRTGVSKEKGLLKAWPKEGPKLVWTYKTAGIGFSSFAVVKGVIYTVGTDFPAITDEYVIAIDEKKGSELWRMKIDSLYTYKGNTYGDGPRSTPTIDGDFLYTVSGNGQLVCLDITQKGKEKWRKHLIKDLGGVMMDRYGVSESVLVDGNNVICTPGGPKGTLAALDKATGKEIWRSKDLTYTAPFASMVVAELHGVRQYVQTAYNADNGKEEGVIAGIEAKTGKLLWSAPIFNSTNDSNGIGTTPIVFKEKGKEFVYASSGIGGCYLYEIDAKQKPSDNLIKKTLVKKVRNAHGGVVMIDGHIYGHTEKSTWFCQEMKVGGAIPWTERQTLQCVSGSVTAADGLVILYTDDGEVGLIPADPTQFKLISSFKLPERSKIPTTRTTSRMAQVWSYPVIANGHLYLRDHEFIFAYDLRPAAKAAAKAPANEECGVAFEVATPVRAYVRPFSRVR